jgi:tetratricopeptide (TPR) repeat protein
MPDPYLAAALRGEFHSKRLKSVKNLPADKRFEEALNGNIKSFVDSLPLSEHGAGAGLLGDQQRRVKMQAELREELQPGELSQAIEFSLALLKREGAHYLDLHTNEALQQAFISAMARIDSLNLADLHIDNFAQLLSLSQGNLQAIATVAIAKYRAEQFDAAQSLLIFLTILQPDNFDYWYRLGIAAQHCGNFPLALRAYAVALKLNDELPGAHLFSAVCFLKLKLREAAVTSSREAEVIISRFGLDSSWSDMLAYVKVLIEHKSG